MSDTVLGRRNKTVNRQGLYSHRNCMLLKGESNKFRNKNMKKKISGSNECYDETKLG